MTSPPTGPAPGWYNDPVGKAVYRYWDGSQWTDQVNSGGANVSDPIDPDMARVPPIPGSAAPTRDAEPEPQQQPTIHVTSEASRGSSAGSIIAVIVAVAALILVLFLAFSLINGDDETTDTTTPTETTQPAQTTAPPEEG